MKAKIKEAIKSVREESKGKIALAADIYEAIFKAGQVDGYHEGFDDGQEFGYKAGYEQSQKDMNLSTQSLADLLLKHQKAGFRKGLAHQYDAQQMDADFDLSLDKKAHEKVKKAGMQEVVDWFEKRECFCLSEGYSMYSFERSELEAFKKENGL